MIYIVIYVSIRNGWGIPIATAYIEIEGKENLIKTLKSMQNNENQIIQIIELKEEMK